MYSGQRIAKDVEGRGPAPVEALYHHLTRRTEETHEKPQSGQSVRVQAETRTECLRKTSVELTSTAAAAIRCYVSELSDPLFAQDINISEDKAASHAGGSRG